MTSRTTKGFRDQFSTMPGDVQHLARVAYRLFRENPYHPSLRFRQVHPTEPIVSVRVGIHYRAVAFRDGEDVVWFWIGSHAEYDQLLRSF
jgi:hypothetical protein